MVITMIKKRLKSKTYWLAIALSALTVAQEQLPALKDVLQDNYSLVMFAVAVAIAVLREVTTKPLSDK